MRRTSTNRGNGVACPTCGTTSDRELLAPGLYRCLNITLEPGWGPHGTEMYPVPCHRSYQEGVAGANTNFVCRCRTLAVRSCARCENPICHDHSVEGRDTWWCRWCVQDRQEEQRRARAEQERVEAERYAALPPLTTDILGRFLQGQVEVGVGRTHQTLELTNRMVLDVLVRNGLDRGGAWGDFRSVFWVGDVGFDATGAVYERETVSGAYEVDETRPKHVAGPDDRWTGSLERLKGAFPAAREMSVADRRYTKRRADLKSTLLILMIAALALAVVFLITAFASGSALFYLPMLALIGTAMFIQSRRERL